MLGLLDTHNPAPVIHQAKETSQTPKLTLDGENFEEDQ
jgi:hypothetical protein